MPPTTVLKKKAPPPLRRGLSSMKKEKEKKTDGGGEGLEAKTKQAIPVKALTRATSTSSSSPAPAPPTRKSTSSSLMSSGSLPSRGREARKGTSLKKRGSSTVKEAPHPVVPPDQPAAVQEGDASRVRADEELKGSPPKSSKPPGQPAPQERGASLEAHPESPDAALVDTRPAENVKLSPAELLNCLVAGGGEGEEARAYVTRLIEEDLRSQALKKNNLSTSNTSAGMSANSDNHGGHHPETPPVAAKAPISKAAPPSKNGAMLKKLGSGGRGKQQANRLAAELERARQDVQILKRLINQISRGQIPLAVPVDFFYELGRRYLEQGSLDAPQQTVFPTSQTPTGMEIASLPGGGVGGTCAGGVPGGGGGDATKAQSMPGKNLASFPPQEGNGSGGAGEPDEKKEALSKTCTKSVPGLPLREKEQPVAAVPRETPAPEAKRMSQLPGMDIGQVEQRIRVEIEGGDPMEWRDVYRMNKEGVAELQSSFANTPGRRAMIALEGGSSAREDASARSSKLLSRLRTPREGGINVFIPDRVDKSLGDVYRRSQSCTRDNRAVRPQAALAQNLQIMMSQLCEKDFQLGSQNAVIDELRQTVDRLETLLADAKATSNLGVFSRQARIDEPPSRLQERGSGQDDVTLVTPDPSSNGNIPGGFLPFAAGLEAALLGRAPPGAISCVIIEDFGDGGVMTSLAPEEDGERKIEELDSIEGHIPNEKLKDAARAGRWGNFVDPGIVYGHCSPEGDRGSHRGPPAIGRLPSSPGRRTGGGEEKPYTREGPFFSQLDSRAGVLNTGRVLISPRDDAVSRMSAQGSLYSSEDGSSDEETVRQFLRVSSLPSGKNSGEKSVTERRKKNTSPQRGRPPPAAAESPGGRGVGASAREQEAGKAKGKSRTPSPAVSKKKEKTKKGTEDGKDTTSKTKSKTPSARPSPRGSKGTEKAERDEQEGRGKGEPKDEDISGKAGCMTQMELTILKEMLEIRTADETRRLIKQLYEQAFGHPPPEEYLLAALSSLSLAAPSGGPIQEHEELREPHVSPPSAFAVAQAQTSTECRVQEAGVESSANKIQSISNFFGREGGKAIPKDNRPEQGTADEFSSPVKTETSRDLARGHSLTSPVLMMKNSSSSNSQRSPTLPEEPVPSAPYQRVSSRQESKTSTSCFACPGIKECLGSSTVRSAGLRSSPSRGAVAREEEGDGKGAPPRTYKPTGSALRSPRAPIELWEPGTRAVASSPEREQAPSSHREHEASSKKSFGTSQSCLVEQSVLSGGRASDHLQPPSPPPSPVHPLFPPLSCFGPEYSSKAAFYPPSALYPYGASMDGFHIAPPPPSLASPVKCDSGEKSGEKRHGEDGGVGRGTDEPRNVEGLRKPIFEPRVGDAQSPARRSTGNSSDAVKSDDQRLSTYGVASSQNASYLESPAVSSPDQKTGNAQNAFFQQYATRETNLPRDLVPPPLPTGTIPELAASLGQSAERSAQKRTEQSQRACLATASLPAVASTSCIQKEGANDGHGLLQVPSAHTDHRLVVRTAAAATGTSAEKTAGGASRLKSDQKATNQILGDPSSAAHLKQAADGPLRGSMPAEFQASGEALRGSAARPFATVASAGLSQKVQQETQKQYLEQLFLQHQRGATSGAEDFSAWRSPAWSVVNNFPNSPYMMSPYMTPAHPASPPPPSPQSGSLYHDYAPLPLTRATVGEGGWPLYRRVTTHSSSTGSQASCRVPAAGSVAEQKKGGKAISSSASRLSMSQERTPASSRGEGRLHSLSRAGDSSTPSGRRSKSSSARPQPPPIRGVGGGPVYKVLWYDRRADVSEFRSREDAFTK